MDPATTKLVQTKFLAFAMKAFAVLNKGRSLGNDKYLKLVARVLTDVAAGKTKRLVVSMPPRHGKTFMASICFSAWILAHNSSAKILVLSYGQDLADKIAYAIRSILRSDWFRQAFDTRLAKNRTKVMDFVTTDGGGVRSLSIEGGVTGLGADFIIIDDPVEIKDCDNSKRLQRVNDLFDDEIQTRLDNPKKGCIVIVAHRVSEDDLPGHVLKKGGWQKLKLPLIARRARSYELADGEIWRRKKGELLRPDAFTQRDIQRLRDSKQPGFETLQQQNPGGSDGPRLKPEYFPTLARAQMPLSELPVVLSIDPGLKGGPTNDYSIIQAYSPYQGGHLLRDQWRERARFDEVYRACLGFINRYRPSVVLIEDTGMGPMLCDKLKPRSGMEIVSVKQPSEDKIERLRKQHSLLRHGFVQLPASALWLDDFIAEVTLFPYAPFDDQVDAMTQYLGWIVLHPNLKMRPPRGLIAVAGSRGPVVPSSLPSTQTPGLVVAARRRWF
jgi:predicted phage terminase large subunit-like protein